MQRKKDVPLDRKSSNSRLFSQKVSHNSLHNRDLWRLVVEFWRVIFVVDIVSNTDKLAAIVGTSQEQDGHAEKLRGGNAVGLGGIGFENELVDADRDRTDKKGIKNNIVLGRSGGADIGELPLQIWFVWWLVMRQDEAKREKDKP
jgi:hypothetical protein